jgi:hypothetical protein
LRWSRGFLRHRRLLPRPMLRDRSAHALLAEPLGFLVQQHKLIRRLRGVMTLLGPRLQFQTAVQHFRRNAGGLLLRRFGLGGYQGRDGQLLGVICPLWVV